MVDKKRRVAKLLPGHLQTETINKVFAATVDHMFQPESVEFLTGYIGSRPSWYNPLKDFYITEPTKARADYQLSPTMISRDYQSGRITNAMFYEDLLGQLRFQGAIVNDPNRLFEQEYYSWCPPIDVDKFVNFGNYYWLPLGPDSIELLETTNLSADAVGATSYTYTGSVRYLSTGEIATVELVFSSGLKIRPTADRNQRLNGNDFFVEMVGRGIRLVASPEASNPGWDSTPWDFTSWDGSSSINEKRYVLINRSSRDGNQWSLQNRWFHADIIEVSKTASSDRYTQQARRPIIEFDPDINLFDYGYTDKGVVDIVDYSNSDFLGAIVGSASFEIDGVFLSDGMRILPISDSNPSVNNKIYVVSGQQDGAIILTVEPGGVPSYGDRVSVAFGSYQSKNLWYDGTKWKVGQQVSKTLSTGQTVTWPLFDLFDVDGINMADPSVYPGSNFSGSFVFSYNLSSSQSFDSELGFSPQLDQFGDYVFANNLSKDMISYTSDNKSAAYVGDLFVKQGDNYTGAWYKAPNTSRQYVVNDFVATGTTTNFIMDQAPADPVENLLPTVFVSTISPDGTERQLFRGVDYTVSGRTLTLSFTPVAGSRVITRSWNTTVPSGLTGYYELPRNLTANPNNEDVTDVTRSQFLQHFIQIISNQTNIQGTPLGFNNYRDSAQIKGLGLSILQHRAPMLKLGLMNAIPLTEITMNASPSDPMAAMQWAQRSYQRFYNRFIQTLFNLASKQGYSAGSSSTSCDPYMLRQWVTSALQQINIGKTPSSPWANSGPSAMPGAYCSMPSTSPTYVPASPTRLGMYPAYKPVVYMDYTYSTPRLVIQTHDGSRIVMVNQDGEQLGAFVHGQSSTSNPEELTDPVAGAWLMFENDLYDNLPDIYRNSQASLAFDVRQVLPGKWRPTDYTRDETLSIERSSFDRWTVSNQIDYRANTGYSSEDQFSYNYRSVTDLQGMPIPGHWQGIYRWFYDTDRPHTHPWEMLGFSQKPSWWDARYGSAPYTNGNTTLWEDLRDGIIREGPRAGTYSAWARPGLMSCIPVDDQGNLLPPVLAGCAASLPDVYSSKSEWQFGDGAPVESTWRNSQEYPFVQSQLGYLLKPARFVEQNWDIPRTRNAFADGDNNQWIYINTNSRRSSNQFYVHRELPVTLTTGTTVPNESTLAYFGSCGMQHWISEYLISQGLDVTRYLGNIVRGGNVQLAHRMAGYINAESLRALVDSFGDLGFSSVIIPSENINTYLYRSTSIAENSYSGVVVERVRNGWRVFGYDRVMQTFTVIPSNVNGSKNSIVIGNEKVVEYQQGLNVVAKIPYGTLFTTRQDLYDFLISYGRYLEFSGWLFDQYSENANAMLDWKQSAKEFLFWSQGNWENGNFIALSPLADSATFKQEFGNIQYVNGMIAGSYPVVDRSGQPIQPQDSTVIRNEGTITVKSTNSQGIFGLKLYSTTLEHAIFFDNTTAFNDVIYQPLYNLAQERIKIYAYRANDWNGRVDAPGYFITRNENTGNWSMVSNFDSTVTDIQKYFNIEQPKNFEEVSPTTGVVMQKQTALGSSDRDEISDIARHLIGYQPRKYMENLLLENATQYEFYQGFIRQKGTRSTIDSLLRNTSIIPLNSTFEYYEEWLIRIGWYGATSLNNVIEFRLPQDRVVNHPQWIRLFSTGDSDYQGDDVLDIVPFDPLIVVPPESYQERLFSLRTSYAVDPATDIPTAGYPMLGETTWTVASQDALLNLYSQQRQTTTPLKNRDTVWQFVTPNGSWDAWMLVRAIGQVEQTVPSQITGAPTLIATTTEHGLIEGDICVIYGVSGVAIIEGTYIISSVTPKTFTIPISTYEAGVGGTILVYRPLRFNNVFERDSSEVPGGWQEGDLCYVDDGGIEAGAWTVYKFVDSQWIPYRQQDYRVAANLLKESKLYDASTKAQISLMNYFDPIQGRISARADAEISYKTDYDPAKYNKGNNTGYALSESEAWDSAQLGMVWWDLSTARYIDYGQGDDRYRIQHWGKIAPGTGIDVYEWIRSPIPPTDWANYVAEGASISDGSRTYIPSGSIRNPENPSWSEVTESIPGGSTKIYYYFWVKNSAMPPSSPNRRLTTANISNLIRDPSYDDRPWYAAISSRSMIIGNVLDKLNSDQTIQQITYATSPNETNTYGEWELIREGDRNSPVSDIVWNKLKSSLVTFDGLGNDVPDYHLLDIQKYGSAIRPRQTWFVDRVAAGKVFVDTFNGLIAANPTPMVDDPSMAGWQVFFDAGEPIPAQQGNWDYRVPDLASRDSLVGVIIPGQVVLVDPTSITNNRWTMYLYGGGTQWTLIREQSYNTANYWEYVDWYFTGYSQTTVINYNVETLADLDDIASPRTGEVVRVENNGANNWQMYAWSGEWRLVGQQDGSIRVLDSIYDWASSIGGFDSTAFDSGMFDSTAATEFANVVDGVRNAIYPSSDSIQINTLLFAMINYALSEQTQVDWLIKTSDIVLKGFNQPLITSPILLVDNVDSIIGFIEEAKPYHAKVREFVTGKSITDASQVSVIDFDVPYAYLTEGTPDAEPVEPEDILAQPNDVQGRSYYQTYKSWYENYTPASLTTNQIFKNPELVRQLTTTLVFDRISTNYYRRGWGESFWDVFGWDDTANEDFGAINRIEQYYAPTDGMIPKIIEDLMGGVAYKGTRLNAIGFNIAAGWSAGEWDSLVGWDPDPNLISIESYLDQIVQGGAVPVYDFGVGTGTKTVFPITQDVYNPNNIVVWSDGNIRVYGAEWISKTYAQSVEIVDGGVGYSVGDQIDAVAGTGLAPARLKITSVNPANGAITGIEILGKGSYTVVYRGPYGVEYPSAYPGAGSDAVVSINWSCTEVEFLAPPTSSSVPNVYMLYIGKTFVPAPTGDSDTIYDGNEFVQPHVDDNHPEELYVYRPRDSVILDVSTEFAGGAPTVATRSYITDGINDQYDLTIVPQSFSGLTAYLDGVLLTAGLAGDFVVNMTTGKMVFITPPPAGQVLNIISYGTGGSSRLARSVITASPGSGYVPGDGVVLNTPIGMTSTSVRIDSTKVVSFTITNEGSGYAVGDQITLAETNGGVTYQGYKTSWRVAGVGDSGNITELVLEHPGSWTSLPTVNQFTLSRQPGSVFTQVEIDLVWGADVSTLTVPGRYYRIPDSALEQVSPPVSGGTGASWNIEFFGDFDTYYFTGDGANTDFYMPGVDGFITGQFLVTVNGAIADVSMMLSGGIRLLTPPSYGSTVVITVFNNTEYSRITETIIAVSNPLILDYTLDSVPDSTRPVYLSTQVAKNGNLMSPPLMQIFRGNGFQTRFQILVDISASTSIEVFVDGVSLGTSYAIDGSNVLILPTPPVDNADIVIVVYKNTDEYRINGNTISFLAGAIDLGDDILVTVYNQDLDYEFHTEMFDTVPSDTYQIVKQPWNIGSIRVWMDGVALVPARDFAILPPQRESGWDTVGWGEQGWNSERLGNLLINIPGSYSLGSKIVVTYMTGLSHMPGTRFRTLLYKDQSRTTAMDLARTTTVISNVLVNATSIEIADYTAISLPGAGDVSYVYINDELIGFSEIQHAPTLANPNRAFLKGLQRNRLGTSGNPRDAYNVLFYNGNDSNIYFATQGAGQAISTTVFVDGLLMIQGIDYEIVVNPTPLVGEFVKFSVAPGTGYRNVKIVGFNVNSIDQRVSHVALSTVYDAGNNVVLPAGYQWEAAENGSQYNRTRQSEFLLHHHSGQ